MQLLNIKKVDNTGFFNTFKTVEGKKIKFGKVYAPFDSHVEQGTIADW